MARMRSLKPEFWGDLRIATVSRDARLLYLALWNQADEWARCHGDIRWIKGHCFPYDDDLNLGAIDRLLNELAGLGRVARYETDGEPFLYLPKLAKHQRLEPQKTPSRLPAPPGFEETPDESGIFSESVTGQSNAQVTPGLEDSADESGIFPERSGRIVVQHVAGSREHVAGSREQEGKTRTGKPAARGTRIPDDFKITDDMRTWARATVPGMDIEHATKRFVYHFQAASGIRGTMVKWDAAWKKWMLGDYKPATHSRPPESRVFGGTNGQRKSLA